MTDFFKTYFEKKPLHLKNSGEKFSFLASLTSIRKLITSGKLPYSELDVTSYSQTDGRKTHNGTGMAGAEAVRQYDSGCSLRLRRPQDHFPAIRGLCTSLESFLECVVGANIYATPANSQGFAPHFDDVDAVICQIHGSKRWRVYKRADEHDVLPRRSSVDFGKRDVQDMRLIMEVDLQPGEVLYLPRGAVHEAICDKESGKGSLHVTVSFCQRWTWADFLLASFERAILETAAVDQKLRESVPLRFGGIAGAGVSESVMGKRFEAMAKGMVNRVARSYPVDTAADMMMERFIKGRLEVVPNGNEGKDIGLESVIRATGSCCVRLVVGEDGLPVFVGRSFQQACLPEEAGGIQFVLDQYPQGVRVRDIPLDEEEDRVGLAMGLVDMRVFEVVKK